MIDAPDAPVTRWLRPPFALDGWRIDVANMTGRHAAEDHNDQVARAIRSAMASEHPDALLLAEYGQDFTRDVTGEGWHASMNYAGFLRPVWRWLVQPDSELEYLGVPVPVKRCTGGQAVAAMTDFLGAVPWNVRLTNLNQLGSHDTPRVATLTRDPLMTGVGVALLMTMPGIPAVFAGDEIGLEGINGEHARQPFPWGRRERWNLDLLDVYRRLIALRRSCLALRTGGLRWVHVSDDQLIYLRETHTERVLIAISRAPGSPVDLTASVLDYDVPASGVEVLFGEPPQLLPDRLRVPGDGPAGHVWRLGRGRG